MLVTGIPSVQSRASHVVSLAREETNKIGVQMAIVYLDPQYQDFASELRSELERNHVQLSTYAEGLFALSVEGWLKEAPFVIVRNRDASPQFLAREIVRLSVDQRHFRKAREENRPAYLHELMAALVESGIGVLDGFIDKGY